MLECKLEDVNATAWSLHRWTPGGNVSTLRSGVTSAGQRHESGCDTHAPAASPKSGLLGNSAMIFFAPYPFFCLGTLLKTRSSAENTMFIVYNTLTVYKWQVIAVSTLYWKPKYFVIGIWILITPLSNNIFSWNLVVFFTDIFKNKCT